MQTRKDVIYKYVVDTYQREIERYGGDCVEICEDYFYYDSKEIINFISHAPFDERKYILRAIRDVNMILSCFINLKDDKKEFVLIKSNQYAKELNISSNQVVFLDRLFRNWKFDILEELTQDKCKSEDLLAIKNSLKKQELNNVVGSIIHMHFNRLFNNNQRLYEYIVYYLMSKAYLMQYFIKK